MNLDHSVYPDLETPPDDLPTLRRSSHGLTPGWKISDLQEGRGDPCENLV